MTEPGDPYLPSWRRPIAGAFRLLGRHSVTACVRLGIHPNTVSLSSIVASTGAGACFLFARDHPALLLAGVGLCYVRLWLNMLDGMVALESGKASRWGEILNDLPDRVSDVVIFAGVAHSGLCSPLLAYWVAILAVLVAYVGVFGQAIGVQREFSGVMAKPWRMVALNVGAWLVLWDLWFGDGDLRVAGGELTALDWTHVAILMGCVQSIWIRLVRIRRSLQVEQR
ncbi:MAG: phosphatidylglycerophosphate synthase [Planctomycetes bacterium]|nr:phosphatidylglycerophosphate synthase [Planctomycetota bacterium]